MYVLQWINGRKEALAHHKKRCHLMPEPIKKQVTHGGGTQLTAPPPAHQTIPDMILEYLTLQERSDWLLTMAIITSDVSFR